VSGILYLLPNLLDENLDYEFFLPASVREIVRSLNGLIAESEPGARRYLRRFLSREQMASMPLRYLNEHTKRSEWTALLDSVVHGERWGVVSDAGLPCIADPGAGLVFLAQQKNIAVVALSGPSAPLLALQLSGLTGQRFAFHGYLPRKTPALIWQLKQLEERSRCDSATQIWIEAPYRCSKIAEIAIAHLDPQTLLCVALNLTGPDQTVHTRTIAQWRRSELKIEKQPGCFCLEVPQ
jgi:16S rRNA (cytidine1402-2'-O)-methyltransferase